MSIIVDASVALAWFLPDESSDYARRVELALATETADVPWIWRVEVINALVIGERRRRITAAGVDEAIKILEEVPAVVYSELPPLAELVALCRRYQRTSYDATYLALALITGDRLATIDKGMRQACIEARVPLFEP